MKTTRNLLKLTEVLMISLIWVVLIATPVLFSRDDFQLSTLLRPIDIYIPLAIIFVLNRFVFVPHLLFKKKRVYYIIGIISIILFFTAGSFFIQTGNNENQANDIHPAKRPPMDERSQIKRSEPGFPPPMKDRPQPVPPFANLLIFSLLLVGFDTGLIASFKWAESEKIKARLEKENVANQLDILRNQVNPHFFMNTLNNIHALIDIDTENAKDAVIQLSKMMRYLLYETSHDSTTLKKEIVFIESYLDLMKLRVSEKVEIKIQLPAEIPMKSMPPFLFISFIENAFKHGISYQKPSFVHIKLILNDTQLHFSIINSKVQNDIQKEGSGIGIENVIKRLKLLYGDNYQLNIIDKADSFAVNLSIPI